MTDEFTFWLDAHLSDRIAKFIKLEYGFNAKHIRHLGGRDLSDREIFAKLRTPGAVLLTKDDNFFELSLSHGAPPQIVWLTFGNSSNERVRNILYKLFATLLERLRAGEALIEISGE